MGYVTSTVSIGTHFTPPVPGGVWLEMGMRWDGLRMLGGWENLRETLIFLMCVWRKKSFERDVPPNSWNIIIFFLHSNWRWQC